MVTITKAAILDGIDIGVTDIAVSLDGSLMLVGDAAVGTVHVYDYGPTGYTLTEKLHPPGIRNFGYALGISPDNTTIIIGSSVALIGDQVLSPERAFATILERPLGALFFMESAFIDVGLNGLTPACYSFSADGLTLSIAAARLQGEVFMFEGEETAVTGDDPLSVQIYKYGLAAGWAIEKEYVVGNMDNLRQAYGGTAWLDPLGTSIWMTTNWGWGAGSGTRLHRAEMVSGFWAPPVLVVPDIGDTIVYSTTPTTMLYSDTSRVPGLGCAYTLPLPPPMGALPALLPKPAGADPLMYAKNVAISPDGALIATTSRREDAITGNIHITRGGTYLGAIWVRNVKETDYGEIIRLVNTPLGYRVITNEGASVNIYECV